MLLYCRLSVLLVKIDVNCIIVNVQRSAFAVALIKKRLLLLVGNWCLAIASAAIIQL